MNWLPQVAARDLVDEALSSLAAHRLRSSLSAIGIVFGVATVVTAFAIGEGARRSALAEIGALGLDNVFVRSVTASADAAPALSVDDMRAAAAGLDRPVAVAGSRVAEAEMATGTHHARATLAGVSPSWSAIADLDLAGGRWLSDPDNRTRRRVAVIGADLSHELFGGADPVGAPIAAGGGWYTIVGRLRGRTIAGRRSTIQRFDVGRALIVPLGAMDLSLGRADDLERLQEISIRLTGPMEVERAARLLPSILARRRVDAARYELVVPRELLRARLKTQRTFDTVLAGIGLLALVISGIGIMNIMLASAAERTQEIGVRRAFGARRNDILAQFTVEAGALCVAGGIAGVPLGAALSGIVALAAGWPIAISPAAVLLALTLAAAVGLLFGVYPARIAAGITPIEALRS